MHPESTRIPAICVLVGAAILFLTSSSVFAQRAAPSRPKITGISHAAFYVSDLSNAITFWHDLLGHDVSYEIKKPGTDKVEYAFIKIDDHQYVELITDPPPAPPSMMSLVSFTVEDLKQMRAYLISKGYDVKAAKFEKNPAGDYAFDIKDTDGTVLEFTQLLPTGLEARTAGKFMPDTRIGYGICHVGFVVGNAPKALAFYHDILGFNEIWRGAAHEHVSWIQMQVPDGTDYVELMTYLDHPNSYGNSNHISMFVPNVQKVVDTVMPLPAYKFYLTYRKQIPPSMGVGLNNRRHVDFRDPDDTRIELMEPQTVDGEPPLSTDKPLPKPSHD